MIIRQKGIDIYNGGIILAWRFRKSFKILPGVNINISKNDISLSLGPKGAKANISSKGVRGTASIPGTGISYSEQLSSNSNTNTTPDNNPGCGCGCFNIFLIIFIVIPLFFTICANFMQSFQSADSKLHDRLMKEKSKKHIYSYQTNSNITPLKHNQTVNIHHPIVIIWNEQDLNTVMNAMNNDDMNTLKQLQSDNKIWIVDKSIHIEYNYSHFSKDIYKIKFNDKNNIKEGYIFKEHLRK